MKQDMKLKDIKESLKNSKSKQMMLIKNTNKN